MKNVLVATVFFAFLSCTHTNNPPNAPTPPVIPPAATDSLLKSYTIYSPGAHVRQVQVFSFDKNSQLAALHSYTYDSTLSWSPVIDSFSIVFTVTGSATPPSSYDILYQYHWAPVGGLMEHHQLYYDNQSRVVRDSIASGNNGTNNTSVHFSYDSISTVGVNIGYSQILGVEPGAVDSLRIDADNIIYDYSYGPPVASVGVNFLHLYYYLFSTNVNPLYNQAFAHTLGCTLVFHGFGDFRSKNLPLTGGKNDGTQPGVGLQYTWTTDSINRVVQGIAMDTHLNVYQVYSYKY